MSDKIRKITDENLSDDEIDVILGDALQVKFDTELRNDLEVTLQQEYRVTKRKRGPKLHRNNGKNLLFFFSAIAAGFAFLLIALNFFSTSSDKAQVMAANYLTNSDIYHSGILKGNTNTDEIRTIAIQAFNAGDYLQAEQNFSLIEDKTEEDIFYSSLSSLYIENYTASIANLKGLAQSESRFQVEARWYLAIAYILNGDETAARALLSTMEPSSWNYDKTQKLLKALK